MSIPLLSVLNAVFRQKIARRRLAIVAASVLAFAYALGVGDYVMRTPEIGIRCVFAPTVNHFNADFLYDKNQPPLQVDDTLVQLGNEPIANWAQFLHKRAMLRREKGDPGTEEDLAAGSSKTHIVLPEGQELIRVKYLRAGEDEPRTVWCRIGRPPLVETLAASVLWFLIKIGLFVVGAMVFWKRPEDRSAAQFFLFCLVSFGAYMGGYHWEKIVTQPTLLVVFMMCSVLLPAVSLHFYLVFPRPKAILDRAPRRTFLLLYGPPAFFLLLLAYNYFSVRRLYQAGAIDALPPLLDEILLEIYCYFGIAALWYLASVVGLIHSYRTAAGAAERNQVKCLLFGTLVSLAPIGYSLYLALAQRQRFGAGEATWPMFLASLCVTVAFTISITRYRLMQLDQLISSGVVYFLISSVIGLVYYGLVLAGMIALGKLEGPSLGQVLAASGTALVLLFGLNLFRDRFTAALNRHFRREKHQLDRTLQRMSQAIEQLVDPATLAGRLLHTSAEMLGASGGAIYLRHGDPPLYQVADSIGPAPALTELSSGCPLVESLNGRSFLALPPPGQPTTAGQRQLLFLNGSVAQALLHEGQLLGMLLLGEPIEPRGAAAERNGGYTADDLHLLAAFTQMTVLALVSAEGHRKIDALNRDLQAKVEKIGEQQRRILALQSQLSSLGNRRADPTEAAASLVEVAPPAAKNVEASADCGVIGSSLQVRRLMQQVRKMAVADSVVLLLGESGTGKELLARAIHDNSPRAERPFVAVHCSALSPTLLESELFGHVKGAFTGAIRDKVGRFEAANGGTLFLDEIGDISLEVQIKLLRVLQERTFERVGSSESLKVDVRIIAATHQDLEALMHQRRFRDDLFFRLNVLPIVLPPLRERAEDIPELAMYFLRLYSQRMKKPMAGIDDDALARLKACSWPGNIRQLENVIQRAVVVAEKDTITVDELPAELQTDPGEPADLPDVAEPEGEEIVLEEALRSARSSRTRRDRELFVRALAAADGNKAEAARALGMARSTFISRLKRLGLT